MHLRTSLLITTLVLSTFIVNGQAEISYEHVFPLTPYNHYFSDFIPYDKDCVLADIDGDSAPEALFISEQDKIHVYSNDGNGNFSLSAKRGLDFQGKALCIDAADIDLDGDVDLAIVQYDSGIVRTQFYLNNGLGEFTDSSAPSYIGMTGLLDFQDLDNDGDFDLFLNTYRSPTDYSSYILLNKGDGTFNIDSSSSIYRPGFHSVAYGDLNGDSLKDMVMMGRYIPGSPNIFTYLFINQGKGQFLAADTTPFQGIGSGDVEIGDVDGDGDNDLFQSGWRGLTLLYRNDGKANFVLDSQEFDNGGYCKTSLGDFDNDGDLDYLVIGAQQDAVYNANLYLNNGQGYFSLDSNAGFKSISSSSLEIADVDKDGDLDILSVGNHLAGQGWSFPRTNYYTNEGEGTFKLQDQVSIKSFGKGSTTFGDVNNDGFDDILSMYYNDVLVLLNNQNGDFVIDTVDLFPQSHNGLLYYKDFDGDQKSDLAIISGSKSTFYHNEGSSFTPVNGPSLSGYIEYVHFAELNGDDLLDMVVLTQLEGLVYFSDSFGKYTQSQKKIVGAWNSDIETADIDGDGDNDLVVCGQEGQSPTKGIRFYMNDGNGNFTEYNPGFSTGTVGSIDLEDIDGDKDLDLLITANNPAVYLNDGDGGFTKFNTTEFPLLDQNSFGEFVDVNKDDLLDIILIGYSSYYNSYHSMTYLNRGNGVFKEVANLPFKKLTNGEILKTDIDHDDVEDLLIIGVDKYSQVHTDIYRNTSIKLNIIQLEEQSILIYPNPTKDRITIKLPNSETNFLIEVFDLNGRKVSQMDDVSHIVELMMPDVEGVYTIRVTDRKHKVWRGKVLRF